MDIHWQVRRQDGEYLYLLLMLEHQSSTDALMSIRIMGYSALLYEDLVMRGRFKLPQRLPAILPVVLYSGPTRWSAPQQVADLLEAAPAGLQSYQPNMRYLLLDEGLLVEKGKLPDENLAALLFRLEHNQGLEPSRKMLQTVLRLTRGPEFAELRKAFFLWVRHVLLPRSLPPSIDLSPATDLSEITAMLTTHTKDWSYYLHQEGLQKGAADVLELQLSSKFGKLPAAITQQLQQADMEQIQAWSLKLLEAHALKDIFK